MDGNFILLVRVFTIIFSSSSYFFIEKKINITVVKNVFP